MTGASQRTPNSLPCPPSSSRTRPEPGEPKESDLRQPTQVSLTPRRTQSHRRAPVSPLPTSPEGTQEWWYPYRPSPLVTWVRPFVFLHVHTEGRTHESWESRRDHRRPYFPSDLRLRLRGSFPRRREDRPRSVQPNDPRPEIRFPRFRRTQNPGQGQDTNIDSTQNR